MLRCLGTFLLGGAALALAGSSGFAANELEKNLYKEVQQLQRHFREKGYKNIGVLKFRVLHQDEGVSDRLGTLNSRLARKLEMALIITNSFRDPIGIVRDASSTAATIPGANHLTAEGRQRCFVNDYPLAWGMDRVVPDVFLTGAAVISADLKTMKVGILSFSQPELELEKLAQFEVPIEVDQLIEMGESFLLRDAFDEATQKLRADERNDKASAEAIENSWRVRLVTATKILSLPSKLHPLSSENTESPLRLEILYDGEPQLTEFRNGSVFVKEPNEGQKVTFLLKRRVNDGKRWGVVLKVNGENSLYREVRPDFHSSMWVLDETLDELAVKGFQSSPEKIEPFRLTAQPRSKTKEIDYGSHVGAISLIVYPAKESQQFRSVLELTEEDQDLDVIHRGYYPEKTASSLGALKAQLVQLQRLGNGYDDYRGGFLIDDKPFLRDSVPAMAVSVRYYRAKSD